MITYKEYNNKCLEDSNFKKEYDDLEPEYDIINAMIKVRKERGLTQKQLSKLTGISQADISRIENGTGGVKVETLVNYMNILGISPNVIFEKLIVNKDLENQIELSCKASKLSEEKLNFVISVIDLLENI